MVINEGQIYVYTTLFKKKLLAKSKDGKLMRDI